LKGDVDFGRSNREGDKMSRGIQGAISEVHASVTAVTTLVFIFAVLLIGWTSGCGEESSTAPCDWATLRITVAEWDGNPITTWIHVENDSRTLRAKDTTSDSGILELQLPPDRYAIRIDDQVGRVWHTGAGWTRDADSAEYLPLRGGAVQEVTLQYAAITLRGLPPDGGDPVPCQGTHSKAFYLTDLSGTRVNYGRCVPDGVFYDDVLPGPYRVQTGELPPEYAAHVFVGGPTPDRADTVWTYPGEETVLDVELEWAGSIAGSVTLPDANTLEAHDAEVRMQALWAEGVDASGFVTETEVSLSDGSFSIRGLVPGKYILQPRARTAATLWLSWYNTGWVSDEPQVIDVQPREQTGGLNWDAAGLLLKATSPQGDAVSLMTYRVALPSSWDRTFNVGFLSSESGAESLVLLPAGSYLVGTLIRAQQLRHFYDQWWPGVAAPEEAQPIEAIEGAISEVSFEMEVGGSIVGTILGSGGGRLPVDSAGGYLEVDAYDINGNPVRRGTIDVLGEYSITGLHAGSYLVRVDPPVESEYLTTWYPAATDSTVAVGLQIQPPERMEGIDVYLQAE